MPIYLRQGTASQEIPLGYFVDSTDGNTEETGLTIANTDIKIWKTGATTLADKNSGGGTHISNGIYYAVLDATDTDTIGPLVIFCHVSGALAVRVECCVLDEAVYDCWFGAGVPTANVTQLDGAALSTHASGMIPADLRDIAGSAVSTSSAQLGVNAVNIGGAAAASATVGTVTNLTNAPSAGDFTATMKTSLNAATPTSGLSAAAVDLIWDEATSGHAGAGSTGKALTDANNGTPPTAADVADAVWDEAIAGHLTGGSTGNALNAAGSAGDPWSTPIPGAYGAGTAGKIVGDNLDAAITTRSTYAGADTSGTTTLLSRLGSPVGASISADIAAVKSDSGGIKTKTDSLTFTAANKVDATVAGYATGQVPLQPTVAGRTLDVTSTGEAGIDLDNVKQASVPTTLTNITVPTVTSLTNPVAKSPATLAAADVTGNLPADMKAITAGVDLSETMKTSVTTAASSATPSVTVSDKTGFSLIAAYDPAKTAAQAGDAMTLTSGERDSVAVALLDLANSVETGYTVRQVLRLMSAALAGKLSGAATTTVTIRNLTDTKARITATVDADGNRTAISLDGA